MSDQNIHDDKSSTDGVTSEGGVWGVGDPKDEEMLAKETVAGDAPAGDESGQAGQAGQDAAFLDVDEADVETSASEGQHTGGSAGSDAKPGTDDDDTSISSLTDALDNDALASTEAPETDAAGSDH